MQSEAGTALGSVLCPLFRPLACEWQRQVTWLTFWWWARGFQEGLTAALHGDATRASVLVKERKSLLQSGSRRMSAATPAFQWRNAGGQRRRRRYRRAGGRYHPGGKGAGGLPAPYTREQYYDDIVPGDPVSRRRDAAPTSWSMQSVTDHAGWLKTQAWSCLPLYEWQFKLPSGRDQVRRRLGRGGGAMARRRWHLGGAVSTVEKAGIPAM